MKPNIRFFHPSENVAPQCVTGPTSTPVISLTERVEQVRILEGAFTAPQRDTGLTSRDFYARFSTRILEAVCKGFEREFDEAHAGSHGHKSPDFLTGRMHLIRQILDQRDAEQASQPVHLRDAYNEVERERAKPVSRWDRKGGRA